MKKTFLIIFLSINSFAFFAQEIYEKPVVDERVELMGVVFRLAGAWEYAENTIPLYDNKIDRYFEKYKNHLLVEYTNTLLNKYKFSLGSAVYFAIVSEIKNGKISFNKNINNEINLIWTQDSIPKYLKLLNDFYKKTKFHNFFIKNETIRNIAEQNFTNEVTNEIDFKWFNNFFRFLPEKKIQIIISLKGGMHNFGTTLAYKDGSEEFYAIIGCGSVDENGFPIFKGGLGDLSRTLVHEICHSFCNPSICEHQDELLPQATVFYQLNEAKLNEAFYRSPWAFLCEIFAIACAFQYDKDNNNNDNVELNMPNQINAGYLWLPQLLEAFEKYKNDTTYKTFKDFMPEIVKLQNSLNPQKIHDEIENNKQAILNNSPTITGTNIPNNCDTVDYNIDHITLYFDKQMYTEFDKATINIFSTPILNLVEVGKWRDKIIGKDKWNEGGTEWTFYIRGLEPDTQYRIFFPKDVFIDVKNYYSAKDNYTLIFKTRPKQ